MNRRTAAVAILLVWVGALGWLVRREVVRPGGELLASAALSLPPGATYYLVSAGGEQIGFASTTIDTLADTLRVTDVLVLEVPVLGTLQRTDAQTETLLSRELRLRSFTSWLRSDHTRLAARGTVSGDTLLTVALESGASHDTLRLPLAQPIVLPSVVSLNVAFGGVLEVGQTYTLRVFDPLLLAERDLRLTIEAESTFVFPDSAALDSATGRFVPVLWDTTVAWAVRHEDARLPVRTWVDRVGQVVGVTSPAGFTLERSAYELAYENFRRSTEARRARPADPGRFDLIRQTAIASNVPLPTGSLRQLRVRLDRVQLAGFDLDGGGQALTGDTLVVTRRPRAALQATYSLRAPPVRLAAFLRPEPLLQVRDPRIEAQARQITGGTRNPVRATDRLVTWVHEHLRKEVTVSVPSALDALERRRGDCNEHAMLFVALARAVGIPARMAAGLVYLDGAFYYHAWSEVWLDDWVAVDPTFGQVPADAAHLRFTVGSPAGQIEMLRLLGGLSIEVIGQADGT